MIDVPALRPELKEKDAKNEKKRAAYRVTMRNFEARLAPLRHLPEGEDGRRDASPAAIMELKAKHPGVVRAATTPAPLHPELTRPLLDAWSMTSLRRHEGRPEIAPWLRGWEDDDEPQTSVIWRRFLPVRWDGDGEVKAARRRDLITFFEAAPPRLAELLETETPRVADWLRKRATEQEKKLDKQTAGDTEAVPEATEDAATPAVDARLAPLTLNAPVAFVLDSANRPIEDRYSLSLKSIIDRRKDKLIKLLIGRRLVVDARLGGLKDGLLHHKCGEPVAKTIDAKNAEGGNWGKLTFQIALLSNEERTGGDKQEVLALRYRVTREGETDAWLVVEKLPGGGEGEHARAITRKEQLLAEHQEWAEKEAADIARRIGLPEGDAAMLCAAACHHDDGKAAKRWQRAFNAPQGDDTWAKTKGPVNWRRLNGYRHEFRSVLDAQTSGIDGIDRADHRFELALHLIAAHHGNARPVIGVGGHDDLLPSVAETKAHEIALRFARLQRRWGPWGLAWWEALLRAADRRASQRLERLDKEKG